MNEAERRPGAEGGSALCSGRPRTPRITAALSAFGVYAQLVAPLATWPGMRTFCTTTLRQRGSCAGASADERAQNVRATVENGLLACAGGGCNVRHGDRGPPSAAG